MIFPIMWFSCKYIRQFTHARVYTLIQYTGEVEHQPLYVTSCGNTVVFQNDALFVNPCEDIATQHLCTADLISRKRQAGDNKIAATLIRRHEFVSLRSINTRRTQADTGVNATGVLVVLVVAVNDFENTLVSLMTRVVLSWPRNLFVIQTPSRDKWNLFSSFFFISFQTLDSRYVL